MEEEEIPLEECSKYFEHIYTCKIIDALLLKRNGKRGGERHTADTGTG